MKNIWGIGGVIIAVILIRLLPHAPNVAPLTALAVFAGYAVRYRWAPLLAPLIALITDFFIGFYDLPVMFAVYGSYLLIALLSRWFGKSASQVAISTFAGSIAFFVVTNAAVWAFTPLYSKTASGLLMSYLNALPFFRNSLLGDLVFGAAFFMVFSVVTRLAAAPARKERSLLSNPSII